MGDGKLAGETDNEERGIGGRPSERRRVREDRERERERERENHIKTV